MNSYDAWILELGVKTFVALFVLFWFFTTWVAILATQRNTRRAATALEKIAALQASSGNAAPKGPTAP